MPVQALCMVDGLAEDNLHVLAELGVTVVLYEFGTTRGDIACLEDLPVHAVKMATRVVTRVADRMDDESLFTRAVRDLVPLVRTAGTPVIVGDIESADQFEWWRAIGATIMQGGYTGEPGPPDSVR
jgi:EAL domain-containing protein (putative c-di-GMP-specific phosphodiesterase class I)